MKRLLIGLAILVTAAPALTLADDLSGGGERHLGGHAFLPSGYVTDPWVGTEFRNVTGGGVATGLKQPFYNLDGEELFVLEGDLFYAALGFGYQQRLGSTWAVGARFSANARSGTNTFSVVAQGANVDRSAHLWLKKRVMRSENSQLTLGLDWDYTKIFAITPLDFARAIASGEDVDSADLLSSVKSWTARGTIQYAHAFSPTYGLRANAAMGLFEEPFTSGVSKATHRLGILFEMDLKEKYGKPVGFTLGHSHGFPNDDPTAGMSGTLLGLWYTGREAFVVGAETGYMTLPAGDDAEDINAIWGLFTLRYYF